MFALTRIRTHVARVTISALAISLLSAVGVISGATTAQAATTVYINDTDAPLAFVKANSTNLIGTGTAVGNVVRYNNVGTYGGVAIEAVVTTLSVTGSVTNYDNPGSASTAAGAANNWMINTSGGEARFRFEFFRAGTYTGANTGIPVVLQNVKITSIDLDCSSAAGSYQYTDATGFQKYAMMSPTNLAVQTVASTNRVRFIANKTGSRSSVPEDQVMLKYDAVQTIEFSFGNVVAAQTNFFGLVFGGWPNGGVPVEYTNQFNTPPTSTDTTINTSNGAPTTLSASNFGIYADADNNPFMSVKLGTVTGGTLEWKNGATWTTVTSNQVVTVADIEKGNLRFTASGASTIQFWVYDGLDFSTNPYTITGTNAASSQLITFNNPGTKGVGSGSFASGATADSGLVVELVSLTPGICTVSGLNIVPVAAGTCVIVAKQPGNSNFGAAAEKTQEFVIVAGSAPTETQTITFPQPADQTVDTATVASGASSLATDNTSLTPTLTSNTPSVCTVTGLTINIVAAGTCTVTASQPGTSTIAPAANVTRSFNVTEVAGGGTVPIAQTWGAAIPTGGSTLQLTGFVDWNSTNTTYLFCWTENAPASSSTKELVGVSGKQRFCSSDVTGYNTSGQVLTPNINFNSDNNTSSSNIKRGNTVYFQIIAYHTSSSKVFGKIMTISSSEGYVTTSAASNLLQEAATLNGTAKSRNKSTRYLSFCVSPEYAIYDRVRLFNDTDKCPMIFKSNPSTLKDKGSTSGATGGASGLKPATYYYYQLMISSSSTPTLSKTSYGNIVRFKTAASDPVATTLGTTGYTTTSATLTGSILANDNSVTPKFCYTETPTATNGILTEGNCIGGLVTATPETISVGAGAINKIATGLVTGRTYYYQAVGVYNSTSKVYGAIKSFTLGAPTVSTLSATGVQLTSGSSWEALLNGFVNPNGGTSTNYFCVAETNTVTTTGAMTSCVTGGGAVALETATAATRNTSGPLSLSKTGLTANTTYYYQAIGRNLAQNPSLDQFGEVLTFITASAPTVTTTQVVLLGVDTATVPGTITANGALTTGSFCVSLSDAATDGMLDTCLARVMTTPATTSGTGVSITGDVTDLAQATKYFYQAIGDNSQGTTYGEILNFTTLAGAPVATTVAASNVANTTATINGRVNPGGAATTVRFRWGTDSGLSGATLTDTITVVSASAGLTSMSRNLESLTAGTTYYFRVEGTNSQGTSQGAILSFKAGAPTAITLPATEVTASSVLLNGSVKANRSAVTAVKFCVSTTATVNASGDLSCDVAYVNGSVTSIATSNTTSTSETASVTSGLVTNTTYYFQIAALTSSETSTGSVLSFTTNAPIGITKTATSVAASRATLNGVVNPVSDAETTAKFCLAEDDELNAAGLLASCIPVPIDSSLLTNLAGDNEVFAAAETLTAGNTYFFQITTVGSSGVESIGQVFSFSTGFAVTFDANGGSGSMNDQVGTTAAALTANAFSKSGSTFTGWATTAGGSVAYADGASYDFTANITLYAVWNAVSTPTTPTNPPIPKFKSKLTWPNPVAITQGTPLSGSQLNANPEVPSTCVYTPALGTVLAAGTYILSVVCTPLDTNYEPTSGTVTLVVKSKIKPKLTWFNPTPITNPTPLGGVQLNATANIPGTYTYSPAAGTVLDPGKYPLNVMFSPDNKSEYDDIEANVTITVLGKNDKPEAAPTAPINGPDTKTAAAAATKIVLQTSGKLDTITVVKTNEPLGVLITATDWSLRLTSTTQFVQGTVQDSNDRVVIEKGNTVTTSGTGFKPFSQVDIWVYSTPTWLGAVITDAYGNFTTTVPMPKALPAGDHTFQAKGMTPESTVRMADVPITLVNPTESGKPGMLKFEVYFGMNSPIVTKLESKRIAKMVKLAQSKVAQGAKITVEISGWVQPNPNPGNIKYLSTNRAKNVATALKALGLKGSYTLRFPGLAKDNIPAARHASVVINWSKSK